MTAGSAASGHLGVVLMTSHTLQRFPCPIFTHRHVMRFMGYEVDARVLRTLRSGGSPCQLHFSVMQCQAACTLSQQQDVLQAQQLTSVAIAAKEDLHVTRRELDEAVSGAEAAAIIRCPVCLQLPHMPSYAWPGGALLPHI